MKEFVIGKNEADQRFYKYIKKVLKEAPNSFIYKMLRKKNITLNGKKSDGTDKTKEGDVVKFFLSDETFDKMQGQKSTDLYFKDLDYSKFIDVIFEDDDIVILNKPANLLTQSDETGEYCLNDYYLAYLYNTGKLSEESYKTFHPSVSNRLDRNTTGLVLCGKSLKGSQRNASILKNRDLEKYYLALVYGKVEKNASVKGYLSKNEVNNKADISQTEKDGYVKIHTEYEIVEAYKNATLLKIHLITGKTHQIRAHLSSLNHPIIGDFKYGNKSVNEEYKKKLGINMQLLHSYIMTEKDFSVKAPIPKMFKDAIDYAKEI